jgi:hypothetical protein
MSQATRTANYCKSAMRVTFLGREVEHRPWTLGAAAGDVEPAFVDHRETDAAGDVVDRVKATRPDVVIALRPDLVPGDALAAETGALALAVVAEEFDVRWETDVWQPTFPAGEPPPRPAGYDRVLATDPLLAREWGAWRSAPLPVDDAYFLPWRTGERTPRVLFLGESTAWRERWLVEPKHHYDLSHYAYGLAGEPLREVLEATNIGVLVRRDVALAAFPPAALLHLAAGHVLLTEPLRPPRGLEPGLDHVEVQAPDQLLHHLHQLRKRPDAFDHVRVRGRERAELFRASVVWPRIVHDLVADVRAFGRSLVHEP